MSIETEFRAALVAYAPLTALVGTGTRISKNAVEQDVALPIVVFSATDEPDIAMNGGTLGTQSIFTVECWAEKALEAANVADQVVAALTAFNASQTGAIATVISRADAYDGQMKLDGDVLTVEWWDL